MIVPADKTRNLYSTTVDNYKKLLHDIITKTYQHAPEGAYSQINLEAREIAERLDIADRTEVLAKSECFITLKDHKENFHRALPCRLINPAKSKLGVVSKSTLANITRQLRDATGAMLWRLTADVINWFKSIEEKRRHTFVVFDIVNIYPSITKELLHDALEFAKQHVQVSDDDMNVIMHARKSLLFAQGQAWPKKDRGDMFNVTMGAYDGAEACEVVGAYILHKLAVHLDWTSVGLYRDDELAVQKDASGPVADRVRKQIIEVFKSCGLKITIESNLRMVNYLDITMCLESGMFKPYRKPNDIRFT